MSKTLSVVISDEQVQQLRDKFGPTLSASQMMREVIQAALAHSGPAKDIPHANGGNVYLADPQYEYLHEQDGVDDSDKFVNLLNKFYRREEELEVTANKLEMIKHEIIHAMEKLIPPQPIHSIEPGEPFWCTPPKN